MALTASLDTTGKVLTVVSDRRIVTVTAGGETANAVFPITITDPNHVWKSTSDDGKTAIFTTP
jgi:hypothetical protein